MDNKTRKLIYITLNFLTFFLISYPILLLIYIIYPGFDSKNMFQLGVVDFVISLLQTIIICLINRKFLKEEYKNLKDMFKKNTLIMYLKTVFIGFITFFIIKLMAGMVVNYLYGFFNLTESEVENQSLIEDILACAPAMMIISSCIFAPIMEEVIFRGAIRQVIKNKWVYIAVSGLIFGLMHVAGSFVLVAEILVIGMAVSYIITRKNLKNKYQLSAFVSAIILLFCGIIYYFQYGNLIVKVASLDLVEVIGSITYITMGVYLAYIYVKNNNIYINIGIHALNNIFSIIAILFLI